MSEVMESPILVGRLARCAYFGERTHRSECNFGKRAEAQCSCEQPSSQGLPFFRYQGEGSRTAERMCTCGYADVAHWPKWTATVIVDREWYQAGRRSQTIERDFHAPDAAAAKIAAEHEANFFRGQTSGEARVYGATVATIRGVRNPLKCRRFQPKGPQPLDEFYCGCHSWD